MQRLTNMGMLKTDRTGDMQYAALPFRFERGSVQIMLITSRETGRWVIPKGWPMPGKKPHQVASAEAHQEAGIKGVISKKPIGAYPYSKRLADGSERLCLVTVFPLRVTLEATKWREMHERRRVWFDKDGAAALVEEGGLAQIIDEWLAPGRKIPRRLVMGAASAV
jgi:8-oxo-dGTP pyrophosphatase MutT (NUDIX family)